MKTHHVHPAAVPSPGMAERLRATSNTALS